MLQVTFRLFRDIGEQFLRPLVKDLRVNVATALCGTTFEDVDVIVLSSGPLDESAYDLVITIEAGAQVDGSHSDVEKGVRYVLRRAEEVLQNLQYPQLSSLKIRVDLILGQMISVSAQP